jgi:hypothetical protein
MRVVWSLPWSIALLFYSLRQTFLSKTNIHDSSFGIVRKLRDGLLENGFQFQSVADSFVIDSIQADLSLEECGCQGEVIYAEPRCYETKIISPSLYIPYPH